MSSLHRLTRIQTLALAYIIVDNAATHLVHDSAAYDVIYEAYKALLIEITSLPSRWERERILENAVTYAKDSAGSKRIVREQFDFTLRDGWQGSRD